MKNWSFFVSSEIIIAIAKCLMMAKTRNAGVFLPHPRASKATAEAVRICCEAGEKAGAPKGWVKCIDKPTMDESNAVMRSKEVSNKFWQIDKYPISS